MIPVVHGLEAMYADQIDFVYLDIEDPASQGLKEALGYRYQPHFFLVDGEGNVVRQWLGLVSQSDFEQAFQEILP